MQLLQRSGVGVVTLYGALFVCGGFDGLIRQNTSELFDPREGRWHTMQSMKLNRLFHLTALSLLRGQLENT